MKIRLFAAVLAAALSLSLLTACGDDNDTKTTTTTEATTTEATTTTTEAEETTTTVDDGTTTASKKTTTTKKATTTSKATYRTLPKTTTANTTAATEPVDNVTQSTTTTKKTVPPRQTKTTKDLSGIFPVKVEGNAEERAAMINNDLKGGKKVKIASVRATVQAHDHDGYSFNHHPDIAIMNGTIYVTYTQAERHEDSPGQQVVVASSKDFFTWTDPIVCGPCTPNDLAPGTVTANVPYGFYSWDGKLYMYWAARRYGPDKFDSQGRFLTNGSLEGVDTIMMASSTDGVNWSDPMPFANPPSRPRLSLTGKWYCHFGLGMAWMDYGEEPDGLRWDHYAQMSTADVQDSQQRVKELSGVLTENSMYESPDNTFHILTRSDAGYLWHHESLDNGETWSGRYPTNFTSASSMWQFGNLPDGRVFGVGSSDISQGRYPLELWLSDDGINFDTCYILRDEYDIAETRETFVPKGQNSHCYGWAKGGQYGYPHYAMDDEYLYVAYSRYKEMMEITRVKLSDIK